MTRLKDKTCIGNILWMIYFAYVLIVVETEWINFVATMLGFNLAIGIAEIVSILLLIAVFYFCRKKFQVEHIRWNIEIIIGLILIVAYGLVISVYPDNAYDTYNYHLIAQNPEFRNYFVEDFGYGNFQVWGFRLSDRLFYYFRMLLGFRYGTTLNIFVLMLAFVQIYILLDNIIKQNDDTKIVTKIFCNRLVWSLAILFQLDSILMFGTYYVDVLAIPVALEILRILLTQYKVPQSTMHIFYFALLNGLWIAFKMTNVIYVVPCVLIYLVFHIKDFKIKDWFIAIAAGVSTWLNYIAYNWVCTGNPVFPYFNEIFKSKYFLLDNFKDNRWGGETTIEKLLWIVYAAFNPEYRQSEIYDLRPGTLIIGLVGTIILCIVYIFFFVKDKKKCSIEWIIYLSIGVSSSILWGLTTGYSRYSILVKIIWGILAFYFLVKLCKNVKIIGYCITCIISMYVIGCLGLNVYSVTQGRNWSWTPISEESFREQSSQVLKDRDNQKFTEDVDLFILTTQTTMGIAELIDRDVYAINTVYPDKYCEGFSSIVTERLSGAEYAYNIRSRNFTEVIDYVNIANEKGFYVKEMVPYNAPIGQYELISIEVLGEKSNTVWTSDEEVLTIDLNGNTKEVTLSMIAGRYYSWKEADIVKLKLSVTNGEEEREIGEIAVDNVLINNFEIPIEVEESDTHICIRAYNSNNQMLTTEAVNKVFVINAYIQ